MASKNNESLENDIDALFKLPLAEFTDARNALAARLKKSGRANEGTLVKALTKPSISAWAVNQLYWKHRQAFDQLIAAGQRVRQAQAGKIADMRGSLEARRESLTQLTDLATALLHDAGHSPTLDTVRSITATLEALSAHASLADGPTPGRLTHDVDPPGFESLASLMTGAAAAKRNQQPVRATPIQKQGSAATKAQPKSSTVGNALRVRQLEETRQARIAAAKASLQDAKKSLAEMRAKTQKLEAAQKKANAETKNADAEAKQAEKQFREAEARFKKAKSVSQDAAERSQSVSTEVAEAARAVEDAKRAVDQATKELESLF